MTAILPSACLANGSGIGLRCAGEGMTLAGNHQPPSGSTAWRSIDARLGERHIRVVLHQRGPALTGARSS